MLRPVKLDCAVPVATREHADRTNAIKRPRRALCVWGGVLKRLSGAVSVQSGADGGRKDAVIRRSRAVVMPGDDIVGRRDEVSV